MAMTAEEFEDDDDIVMGIDDDDEDVGCDAWWRGWGFSDFGGMLMMIEWGPSGGVIWGIYERLGVRYVGDVRDGFFFNNNILLGFSFLDSLSFKSSSFSSIKSNNFVTLAQINHYRNNIIS